MALTLFLAGCGAMVPRTAPPRVAPPPPAKHQPAPSLPEDRLRHRVALLVPLSGPNGAVGQSIANAATLALADTKDHSLRLTTYDTATGAAAAAQRALADGNRLFLGPLLGEDVKAVSGPAEAAGVPVIAFSNDVSAAGKDVWLLGFQPSQSVERVIRYARSRGLSRFAALMPQGEYGRSASTAMIHAVEDAGGSVVAMQSYARNSDSLGAAVVAIGKQKYDAVMVADSGRIVVHALPLIRKHGGAGARLLGTELWNAEPGLNKVPDMAGAWFASVDDAMFEQLAARYRGRYGRTPYRLASLGYDAVLLAVRIAADWKPDAPFPVDRLDDDAGFSGVDGAFRFDGDHIAERALAVHQIGPDGGLVISPAPKGFR